MKKLAFALAVLPLLAAAPWSGAALAAEEIPVIIKATDSDFWQYVWVGAKNYELEHPDEVKVTLYGPKSEADIDKQLAILEDVIAKNPKCIVMASTSSDAPVAAFEKARAAGTKIVTIDNKVNTEVETFLATDNTKGGALAADMLVEGLKAKNVELKGKVAVISAMAGIQVLGDRDKGFIARLKEIAPDVKVLETKYVDNDIVKAMGVSKDLMSANPDLIGFFADNNHTGDGVARAVAEEKGQGKMVTTAFDSDPEEVKALGSGTIHALVLQDPYGMGYKGVDSCLKAMAGEKLPAYVNTGATAVKKDNMDQPEIKGLLESHEQEEGGRLLLKLFAPVEEPSSAVTPAVARRPRAVMEQQEQQSSGHPRRQDGPAARTDGPTPRTRGIVRMTGISKAFPGVQALDGVDLVVRSGEVHALVGENGAGKSTLIKVLMGAYRSDTGHVALHGEKVEIRNPIHARSLGLGAVYQDVTLARHLSVGENFFLGKLPTRGGLVDWPRIWADTRATCEPLGIRVDPRALVKDLTVAQQEMITIAKVVHGNARLMIFDEPTALLANEETQELFEIIRKLKEAGVGVVYISHRLEEIFSICDTVTVLKDGKRVRTMPIGETNQRELVALMVGRKMEDMYGIARHVPAETVLSVRGLGRRGRFEDVSFELRKGEILGFFGLVGSGRTDVVRCLFGADRYDSGELLLHGRPYAPRSPGDAIERGLGLLPEDRKQQGLAMALSVARNVNMGNYGPITRRGFINLAGERAVANRYVKALDIRTPSIAQRVGLLSGGNQQKVVIGRWLNRGSRVFIFDEPTVGIDVGAKAEIYRLFEVLVGQGDSVIIVSSYLPEVMGLADRIVVMREGHQMGIVEREEFSDERILAYATAVETGRLASE